MRFWKRKEPQAPTEETLQRMERLVELLDEGTAATEQRLAMLEVQVSVAKREMA